MSQRRIQVFDTTLRDGEQSPGIALQPYEKAEIAEQLERLGVDVIEAGFAGASPGDFSGVRAVAQAVDRPTVASLARTVQEDLDAAAEALAGARRSRIHIFLATSALHMEKKLGLEPQEVLEKARWSVAYAVSVVDEVEFSCEDATRSDPAFVAQVCRVAIEAGATIINLPDTVGYALPAEYAGFLADVRSRCPEIRGVTLSVHCHNDLGLAVANSLAGIQAGAEQVECTVNGIGERAGNASLEEIVMALHVRGDQFEIETGNQHGRDHGSLEARIGADGLCRAAEQGCRRRERVRTRGRYPPGRDAEGRTDVPDHESERRRRAHDASARQALGPSRVCTCVRRAGSSTLR